MAEARLGLLIITKLHPHSRVMLTATMAHFYIVDVVDSRQKHATSQDNNGFYSNLHHRHSFILK